MAADGWSDLDRLLQGWFIARRTPKLNRVLRGVTRFGSTPAVCAGVTVASIGLRAATGSHAGRRPSPAGNLAVLVAGIGVRRLCLMAGRRQRPAAGVQLYPVAGYSFPSGHSTNAAMASALITASVWDVRSELPGVWPAVATAGACYTVAIGSSRVYLGVHWPSDVLAGWVLGLAWSHIARRYVLRRAGSSATEW
ncbi:MAG TPA: phosphatase PAP2 family protein [Jatrophihabitans sp.]|nr:phosphatase PAP2 family protein [Jatrophihabitans sp.]